MAILVLVNFSASSFQSVIVKAMSPQVKRLVLLLHKKEGLAKEKQNDLSFMVSRDEHATACCRHERL
ncbi:MAG: hypothetical protein K0A99_10575 [Desulfoarculaceae bacterium]|nr:hypothetical protein [Desulfoarculaceae bacterium]